MQASQNTMMTQLQKLEPLEDAIEMLRGDQERVEEQHVALDTRVEQYHADHVAGSRDGTRVRFTGDALHAFWNTRGEDETRALLLSWYDSYQQHKRQKGEGNKRQHIVEADLYTMPRARGQQGSAHWIVLDLPTQHVRNHMCHALFHSPQRQQDTTWRDTRP